MHKTAYNYCNMKLFAIIKRLRVLFSREISYDVRVWSLRDFLNEVDVSTGENVTVEAAKKEDEGYRFRLEFYSDRVQYTIEQQLISVRGHFFHSWKI